MGREKSWVTLFLIGLFLRGTSPRCAVEQPAVPRISVVVCDQAGLPKETLTNAQRLATSVFREAAIDLLWMDGKQSPVSEARNLLRIHCCYDRLRKDLPHRTMGFAPVGGRHITVFWDRITIEAASAGLPEGLLLGYVMAHELGHLLLPAGYHSPYGIMQSRLRYDDWSRTRRVCSLFFSKEEANQMQLALKDRSPY